MKQTSALLSAAAAALLLLAGCGRHATPSVEGQVVDATIHSVTVGTPDGETVTFSTLGTDPMLVPGVLPGDVVKVYYEVFPDEEIWHAVQLDITAPSAYRLIPGIWRDCSGPAEVGLVLAEDGSARAVGLQDVTLQDWSLDGDNLVLTVVGQDDPKTTSTQVLKIERLDADSLVVNPVGEGALARLALSRSE